MRRNDEVDEGSPVNVVCRRGTRRLARIRLRQTAEHEVAELAGIDVKRAHVPSEAVVSERMWQATPAARNSRVYCVRDEYLNTPAPTLLQGLDALAFAIHPDLFGGAEGIRQITSAPSSTPANLPG